MEKLNSEDGQLFIKVSSSSSSSEFHRQFSKLIRRLTESGQLRANTRKSIGKQPPDATTTRQECFDNEFDQPIVAHDPYSLLRYLELARHCLLLRKLELYVPQHQTCSTDLDSTSPILYSIAPGRTGHCYRSNEHSPREHSYREFPC
jgi:hypothetical protein